MFRTLRIRQILPLVTAVAAFDPVDLGSQELSSQHSMTKPGELSIRETLHKPSSF